MTETECVTYTGRNGREVRLFLEGDAPSFRRWVQRNGTGLQAWHYVREQHWDRSVVAAAWDNACWVWRPVRKGDTITRHPDGFIVVTHP